LHETPYDDEHYDDSRANDDLDDDSYYHDPPRPLLLRHLRGVNAQLEARPLPAPLDSSAAPAAVALFRVTRAAARRRPAYASAPFLKRSAAPRAAFPVTLFAASLYPARRRPAASASLESCALPSSAAFPSELSCQMA
jgi:hypothetical protein